ncbi:S1C family serine protease [Anaerotignum sp.]|uniref:S1C family serine protease n=1 Tax=Anaerotignum sp. TaxID=2039241 RepID=UPI0028AEF33C|nr:trypsin-like peptidase domain-containing protein [Anaerotignum sp.]
MFEPEDMNQNNKNKETDNSEVVEKKVAATEPEPIDEPLAESVMEEVMEPMATEAMEAETLDQQVTPEMAEQVEDKEDDKGDGPSVREYHYEEQVKKTPKRKRNWGKFIAACLIVSIAGGASIGAGYGAVKYYFEDEPTVTKTPVIAQKVSSNVAGMSAVDIIKGVKPSVVSISTKVSGTADYFGSFSLPYESNGVGSGVIFYSDDAKIAIATNNHVIDGATSIYVTLEGDATVPAKVVGTKSESDLAVLTVSWNDLKSAGVKDVSVASFGDSDSLEVGDSVIAIGNAMGMGLSATDGMVSMTEQNINVEGNQLTVLQTSAAINGGNSGGPLVNSAGEVVGINTAKYNSSMAEGMGYAIPSNVIVPIVEELLENGTQPKPYIGIKGTSITSENANLYKLPVGALIMEVTEGGPAESAGIMVGDIITSVNGKTVMDMDSLVQIIGETKVGDTVDVHVVRNGETAHDLKLTIADKNN